MSLRDELAQVLASHELRCHVSFRRKEGVGYECGCGAEGMGYHGAHQADAVIAHLALTEETAVRWPWSQEPEKNVSRESAEWRAANIHTADGVVVRRYVTPWENT